MLKTKKIVPWLYIGPAILVIVFIYGFAIVKVFDFSFRRIRGISGIFIGFDNYKFLFKDIHYQKAVLNNATLLLLIPLLIFISLIFAVLLFEKIKGWKTYRVVLFIPYMLPIPVIGIVFGYMFTLKGVVNKLLQSAHLDFLVIDWLGISKYALWTLMIIILWKEIGFGIAIFFARLMSID